MESEEEAEAALSAGADGLLLDNRSPEELERLVRRYDEVINLLRQEGQRIVSLDGTKTILELHEEAF